MATSDTLDDFKKVVVIGTSAGGLNPLKTLIFQLRKGFDAPILVVQHLSPDAQGNVFLDALNRIGAIRCEQAVNGAKLKKGHLYVARPDHHLMIDDDQTLIVTKGARENRFRPAIDPLFRSAAVVFANQVIGVILTGYLDDGTAGMIAIQRCGGICIVQDPTDAEYPDMPKSALSKLDPDFCLPVSKMGELFYQLLQEESKERAPIPNVIRDESKIAKRVLNDLSSVEALGKQVPFNCPGCGGVLWEIENDPTTRFCCYTGHAYTAAILLAEQTMKIEETMWTAMRMFQARKNLLIKVAENQKGVNTQLTLEQAEVSQVHIDRIKAILLANDKSSSDIVPV
jgi:two-component system chemotaxis response regulator CheB